MTLTRRRKEESPVCPPVHLSSHLPREGRGLICWGAWMRGRKDVAVAAPPLPPGAGCMASHSLLLSSPRCPFQRRGPGRAWATFSTLWVTPATAAQKPCPSPASWGRGVAPTPTRGPGAFQWARAGCSLSASHASDPEERDCSRASETGGASGYPFLQAAFDGAPVIKHLGHECALWAGAWPAGTCQDQDGAETV